MSLKLFKDNDYLLDEEGLYDYESLFSGNSFNNINDLPLVVTNSILENNLEYLRENFKDSPSVHPKYYGKLLDNFSVRLYNKNFNKENFRVTLRETIKLFNFNFNVEIDTQEVTMSKTLEEHYQCFLELLYQKAKSLSSKKCTEPKVFFEGLSKVLNPIDFLWEFYYVFGDVESPLSYIAFNTPRDDFDETYYSSPYFPEMIKFLYHRGFIIDVLNPNVVYLKRTPQQISEMTYSSSYYNTLKKTMSELWSKIGGSETRLKSYLKSADYKVFMKNILTSRNSDAKKFHSRNLNQKSFDSFCKEILKEQLAYENSPANTSKIKGGVVVL